MTVDSHCHLADAAFAGDLDRVVERARGAGVTAALCILSADEQDEIQRSGEVVAAWPAVRFAASVAAYLSAPALPGRPSTPTTTGRVVVVMTPPSALTSSLAPAASWQQGQGSGLRRT